jgi:hypothetical protein
MGLLAGGVFWVTGWLKKRTLYQPAPADSSQPISQEEEKRREQKIRSRQTLYAWGAFVFICLLAYGAVALASPLRKVRAALSATETPTLTVTPLASPTRTITSTPKDSPTPRATVTGLSTPTPVSTKTATSVPITQTPRVVYQSVQVTKLVPVYQTVVVYQTVIVIVTPTYTFTPSPTGAPTETFTPTITLTPTATFTETPTETPTGVAQ